MTTYYFIIFGYKFLASVAVIALIGVVWSFVRLDIMLTDHLNRIEKNGLVRAGDLVSLLVVVIILLSIWINL